MFEYSSALPTQSVFKVLNCTHFFLRKIENVQKNAIILHTARHFEQKMSSMCRTVFNSVVRQDSLAIGAASVWRAIARQFVFSEKNAKTEETSIFRQIGRPILRFWESRGPGSFSGRSAYLAADLKIRKFGVVKIAWNLSRTPKTSNFEKKNPEGNASRRIPSRMAPKLSKSL